MPRSLAESLEVQIVVSDSNLPLLIDNMCSEWGIVPYPQLSVMLVHLKFLAMVHQNHHWTAKGDSFYGDHKLFEELYDHTVDEIDSIAERAIGLGTTANVDLVLQTAQLQRLVHGYGMSQTVPQSTELAKRSLIAEMNFIAVVAQLVSTMKENCIFSDGTANLIAGIQDNHERNVYLLKQRCTRGTQ